MYRFPQITVSRVSGSIQEEVKVGLSKNHRCPYSQAATEGRFYGKVPRGSLKHNKLNINRFPVITMTIAGAYICFFFVTTGEMIHRLCLLPLDDFTLSHLIRVTVAGTFVHTGIGHFIINMIFLGVIGPLVESRLTPGQYLSAVLLGSVLSRLISLNLLVSQIGTSSFNMLWCQPTGASGAIAGLMGCFVMRYWRIGQSGRRRIQCYALMPLWAPVGATLLVVIFLARDLAGFAPAVFNPSGMAIFWGHTGGLLGGLVLALVFALQDDNPVHRPKDVGKRSNGVFESLADDCYHLERIC
jgi:membrane associated rhomboid family serine protease